MADTSQYEDQIIRRVFALALREEDTDAAANPPVICLKGLAEVRIFPYCCRACLVVTVAQLTDDRRASCTFTQELQSEERPLLFGKDTVDRAIMARLLDAPLQYPQWPLHYLIGCYGRATAESRQLSTVRDKDAANRLQQDLQYCKELIASNAGLLLTMSDSLFPQVGTIQHHCAENTHRSTTEAVLVPTLHTPHLCFSTCRCKVMP